MGSSTLPIFQNDLCDGLIKVAPSKQKRKFWGHTAPNTHQQMSMKHNILPYPKVHNMFSFLLLLVLLILSSFLAPPRDGGEGDLLSLMTIHMHYLFGSSSLFFFEKAGVGELLVVGKFDCC